MTSSKEGKLAEFVAIDQDSESVAFVSQHYSNSGVIAHCATLREFLTGKVKPGLFDGIGFVTYQHHTHPEIPWFEDLAEWALARTQVTCTAHVQFPEWIDWLLLRIMNHTAHHIDPTIPLYRLRRSQVSLDAVARAFPWSLASCLKAFANCKLYDFEHHQWLDFDRRPTAATQSTGGRK